MRYILILSCFISSLASVAQYTPAEASVHEKVFKLSALYPGIEYELDISRYTSINAFAGIKPDISYANDEGFLYYLHPQLSLQLRHYYNLRKRAIRNKRVEYNSADFLGLHLQGMTNSILTNAAEDYPGQLGGAIVWGLQRTYHNGFYFALYLGPGASLNAGNFHFQVFHGLRLGHNFMTKNDRQEAKMRRLERKKLRDGLF